jgi:hypothetical protein
MWYRVGILDNVRLGGGGYNTTRVGIYIFGVRSITHSHILISKSTALTTRVLYIVSVCIDTTLHASSPSKHHLLRIKLSPARTQSSPLHSQPSQHNTTLPSLQLTHYLHQQNSLSTNHHFSPQEHVLYTNLAHPPSDSKIQCHDNGTARASFFMGVLVLVYTDITRLLGMLGHG